VTTPRKVLYVAKTSTGGAAFSLYHLVRGLDQNRYEPIVLFLTQKDSYIEGKLAEAKIEMLTLEKENSPTPSLTGAPVNQPRDIGAWLGTRFGKWTGRTYTILKTFYRFGRVDARRVWSIMRLIHRHKVDLVHVNDGLSSSKAGIVAAWLSRRACVCHVRMFFELNSFDKLFARFVDSFVFISGAIAEDTYNQGVSSTKGVVVHNAVELSQYTQPQDTALVREEFGWTSHQRLVGVIGRLDWWKGHEYFMEALAELAPHMPEVRGLIVGEAESGPLNEAYFQRLQTLTTSLGLTGKVVFTGFRSDIPRLMSALDVVVLSSSEPEPFGRVIIEGMAAGRPVVATAAGGVLDIIDDGETGLLVPRRDARAMAQAIAWLLSNQEKAAQIGQAARQRVKEAFTVSHHVTKIQAIYDSILNTVPGYPVSVEEFSQ
jgi:glycosyltransferase involved in cell wall biosynthesis